MIDQAIANYLFIMIRILVTAMAVVYTIFAVLMSRQIGQMTEAVKMKDSGIILMLGYVHLIFAILVLFLALTML
ncbi:MAG: DUF5657 family protein [bacterium]